MHAEVWLKRSTWYRVNVALNCYTHTERFCYDHGCVCVWGGGGGGLGIMNTGVCVQFWEGNGSYFSHLGGRWNTPIWVCIDGGDTYTGFISSWKVSMPTVGISLKLGSCVHYTFLTYRKTVLYPSMFNLYTQSLKTHMLPRSTYEQLGPTTSLSDALFVITDPQVVG